MKKQKNTKSFADLAKAIVRKYKRRLGENFERSDKMAEAAMQKELDALMMEQEEQKAKMVQQQFQEMPEAMAYGGGLPQMDGLDERYGYPSTPGLPYDTYSRTIPSITMQRKQAPMFNVIPTSQDINNEFNNAPTGTTPSSKSWFSQIPNESKIGAAAQLAGVLGQGIIGLTAGKPKPLKFNPTQAPKPELVRNDEQLAQATRAYRGAQNNLRYLSPSQYMAAMNDLATREAATKAGIIEGTENQNVGIKNQNAWQAAMLGQQNEQERMRVEAMNEAARLGYVQNAGQSLANVAGVAAGFARDEGARKMQNSMMGFMSQANYGSRNVNGYPVATHKLGTLEYWNDPDGTPHWENAGVPVDQKTFIKLVEEHFKRQ